MSHKRSYNYKNIKRTANITLVCLFLLSLFLINHYRMIYKNMLIEYDNLSTTNDQYVENIDSLNNDLNTAIDTLEKYKKTVEDQDNLINNKEQEIFELLEIVAANTKYPDRDYFQLTYVWYYLKYEIGLNDYVAAGIIGNIMIEVGGATFDISRYSCRDSISGKYYGICQWGGSRKTRLLSEYGGTLKAQCEFLHKELFEVIKPSNSFYELQDEKEAALYFAKKYERCAERSYEKRMVTATYALEYFTNIHK